MTWFMIPVFELSGLDHAAYMHFFPFRRTYESRPQASCPLYNGFVCVETQLIVSQAWLVKCVLKC
jgi:hypothetical protein